MRKHRTSTGKHASDRRLRGAAVALVAALAASALLAAPAVAQNDTNNTNQTGDTQVVYLNITTHDEGGDTFWFEFERTEDERNPPVYLPPGSHVIANVTNVGAVVHNFHVDSEVVQNCTVQDCATELLETDQSATIEFDVPEDAPQNWFYWCDPHRGQGMEGEFTTVEGADGGDGGDGGDGDDGGGEDTPGFTAVAVAAAVGAAVLLTRRRH